MARISKSVIGKISGTLGDVAFRQVNGKTILVQKTKSFIPGTDAESVWRRERFGIAVKLSQAIYSIPELKTLWQKVVPRDKSAYNFILRSNLRLIPNTVPLVEKGPILGSVLLAPDFGFDVKIKSANMSADSLAVELAAMGAPAATVANAFPEGPGGINSPGESKAKLVALLCLSGPTNISLDKFKFIGYSSDPAELTSDAPLRLIVRFAPKDLPLISNYRDKNFFFSLVTLDNEGSPVRHTKTTQAI